MNNNLDKAEKVLKANGIVYKRRKILFFVDSIRVKKENTNLNIVINQRNNGKLTVNAGVGILDIVTGVIITVILGACYGMFKGLSLMDSLDWITRYQYILVGGGIAGQGAYTIRKKNVVEAMQMELDEMMEKDKSK